MGEIVKKCYKCETVKIIEELYFREDSQKCRTECIQYRNIKQKECESKNRQKIKGDKKEYFQHDKKKFNESRKTFFENRRNTHVNFRLIYKTRRRSHHALKGK